MPYLNEITVIESNSTHKGSQETEIVKTLHGGLIKVPASKAGMKVTRGNKAMHAALKPLIASGEVNTIGKYVIAFTSNANRAKTGLARYSQWDNSLDETFTKKREADQNLPAPAAKKIKGA